MNEPLAFSWKFDACNGAVSITAVIASWSASVSFRRTPGGTTLSVPLWATAYASGSATGALSGVMWKVTVAALEVLVPAVALYVNVSVVCGLPLLW